MSKIRLAICDDDVYLCRYWKLFFDSEEDFECVGCVNNKNDCIELCQSAMPEILLLDIQMETNEAGLDIIPDIRTVSPNTKIIMMSAQDEDKYIFKSYSLGAKDYIFKTMPEHEWIEIIKNVHENNNTLRPEIAEKLMIECQKRKECEGELREMFKLMSQLTTVQLEVLRMVSDGYSYKEISKLRYIEESTVRVQINKILKKFPDFSSIKILADRLRTLGAFDIL